MNRSNQMNCQKKMEQFFTVSLHRKSFAGQCRQLERLSSSPLMQAAALVHLFNSMLLVIPTKGFSWILTSSNPIFKPAKPQPQPQHPTPVLGIFKELPCNVLPILGSRKGWKPGGHPWNMRRNLSNSFWILRVRKNRDKNVCTLQS